MKMIKCDSCENYFGLPSDIPEKLERVRKTKFP